MVGRRLWGVAKRGASFCFGGIFDELASRMRKKEVNFGKLIAAKANKCKPWSNHIESSTLVEINSAIKDGNFRDARALLNVGAKEGAKRYCLDIALLAIDFLAEGIEDKQELFGFFLE